MVALLVAVLDLPYGYYALLRWVVMISAILLAYTAHKIDKKLWASLMVIIGILFNPILPITFGKDVWVIIDLIVAGLFFISMIIFEISPRLVARIKELIESRSWNVFVKISISIIVVVLSLKIFAGNFKGPYQMILSFEEGYSEISSEESTPSLLLFSTDRDKFIDRVKEKNPQILSKDSFSISTGSLHMESVETRQLYPREFIDTQCKKDNSLLFGKKSLGSGKYSTDCFLKICKNYPNWKIKHWRSQNNYAYLIFLITPVAYFILWSLYKKIALSIISIKTTREQVS